MVLSMDENYGQSLTSFAVIIRDLNLLDYIYEQICKFFQI